MISETHNISTEKAIVSTDRVFPVSDVKEAELHLTYLKEAIFNTVVAYAEVGKELRWFRDNKRYKDLGYDTFEDFSKSEFDLVKASAYNYIKVAEVCAIAHNEADSTRTLIEIKPPYKDYSFSQLIELSKLSNEEREVVLSIVSPKMSVREMKAVIKKNRDKGKEVSFEENYCNNLKKDTISIEGTTWKDLISEEVCAKVEKALIKAEGFTPTIEIVITYKKIDNMKVERRC